MKKEVTSNLEMPLFSHIINFGVITTSLLRRYFNLYMLLSILEFGQQTYRLDMCSNVQTKVTKKKNEQPAHCNMIRGKKPVPKEFFLMQQHQSGS